MNDKSLKIDQILEIFEKAKVSLSDIEIDLESEELDVKRDLLEWQLKFLFDYPHEVKKLQPEEFRVLEKSYDQLQKHLKNEPL